MNGKITLLIYRTFLSFLEEERDERFLGSLHELNDALHDGILVLVQPAVDVVLDLRMQVKIASQL